MPTPLRASGDGAEMGTAPWYRVPPKAVVSIEHPCLVKNIDKAITMVGGQTVIAEAVLPEFDGTLGLRFHPEDKASRSIISFNNETKNVLLRVTLPKRTGRKRKRGSDEPFLEDTTHTTPAKDARYVIRSLADNQDNHDVEPIGSIQSTHVWRSMPDLVYSTAGSKFLENFRTKIIPEQYPLIKQWELPRTYGLTDIESIPPPVLSTVSIAHNYSYRQNPAVKQVTDLVTGQKVLHNTQAPIKIYTHQCHWDTPEYPSSPPEDCPPLSSQPINLQHLANTMAALFAERPLWTRRALLNNLPSNLPLFLARYAIAYVAFAIRSGPWRDTYCALGSDPRSSPDYRKYQTILLQLVPKLPSNEEARNEYQRKWSRSRDTASHVFTGHGRIPEDGKVWQLCDIVDPQLAALVNISSFYLRAECERRYFGWYLNGTTAKMRVILKAKTDALTCRSPESAIPFDPPLGWTSTPGNLDETVYEPFLALPEEWYAPTKDDSGRVIEDPIHGYLPGNADRHALEWASAYRSMCRCPPGSVPQGAYRLTKTKPDVRASFVSVAEGGGSVDIARPHPVEQHQSQSKSQTQTQSLPIPPTESEEAIDTMTGYEEPAEGDDDDDADLAEDFDAQAEVDMAVEEERNNQQAMSSTLAQMGSKTRARTKPEAVAEEMEGRGEDDDSQDEGEEDDTVQIENDDEDEDVEEGSSSEDGFYASHPNDSDEDEDMNMDDDSDD